MTFAGVRRLLAVEARRTRGRALLGRVVRPLAGLGVAVLLSVPVRATFLGFLDQGPEVHPAGLAGAWLRAGLVVLTAGSLAVHGRVLHGASRRVLALLPVDPSDVVVADLVLAARRTAWIALLVACAFGAVAREVGPAAWGLGLLVLFGSGLLGLVLGALVLLGAVRVAEDPRWLPLLDAVRGQNPPAQAAIVWALAPSTLVGGWLLALAGGGAAGTAPVAGVAAPWLAALLALPVLPALSRSTWWRAGFVVADIRARYALVERPEEAGRVWLDGWAARLPAPVGREMLLLLRYGWRERRGWLSALWLVGLGAVVVGWTEDPAAAGRVALVLGAGAWWAGALPVLAAGAEPSFLRVWLPREPTHRALGAGAAAVAWGLAPIAAGVGSVGLRQGLGAAGLAGGGALVLLGLAGAMTALVVRAARPALPGYVGAGALVLGAAAWGVA